MKKAVLFILFALALSVGSVQEDDSALIFANNNDDCFTSLGYWDEHLLNTYTVFDGYIYNRGYSLYGYSHSIRIFDATSPGNIHKVNDLDSGWYVNGLSIKKDNYLYVNDNDILILDMSDPVIPVEVSSIDLREYVRDMEVFDNYIYALTDTAAGTDNDSRIRLYDISDKSNPVYTGDFFEDDDPLEMLLHNGYLFIVMQSTANQQALYIYDTGRPESPVYMGEFRPDFGDNSEIKMYLTGASAKYIFIEVSHRNIYYRWILDISDVRYPDVIGEHEWSSYYSIFTGPYVIVHDPGQEEFEIYDIRDPRYPVQLSYYRFTAPENVPIMTDGKMILENDRIYNLFSDKSYMNTYGLQIVDISDKSNPVLAGEYFSVASPGFDVVDGIAVIANGVVGIDIVDFRDPESPSLISEFTMPGYHIIDVKVRENTAYLYDISAGIRTVDISDMKNPKEIGKTDLDLVQGSYYPNRTNQKLLLNYPFAYLVIDSPGKAKDYLSIINVSNPAAPVQTATYLPDSNNYQIHHAELDTGYLFVGNGDIEVADVSHHGKPEFVTRIEIPDDMLADSFTVENGYLYLASPFTIIDITNLDNPDTVYHDTDNSEFGYYIGSNQIAGIYDNIVYLWQGTGMRGMINPTIIIDVSDPKNPRIVAEPGGIIDSSRNCLQATENYLYLINDDRTFNVLLNCMEYPPPKNGKGDSGKNGCW